MPRVIEGSLKTSRKELSSMSIQKIPLQERFERIRMGYAADPEFITSAIHSMATCPVLSYLSAFDAEKERLQEIFEGVTEQTTYQEAALHIQKMLLSPESKTLANEAAELLAVPLRNCYQRRKEAYGSHAEDAP